MKKLLAVMCAFAVFAPIGAFAAPAVYKAETSKIEVQTSADYSTQYKGGRKRKKAKKPGTRIVESIEAGKIAQ